MKNLMEHPTVKRVQEKFQKGTGPEPKQAQKLDSAWLRKLVLDLGADDAGFVELDRAALATDREDILTAFPRARSLVGIVCRMNREPIRSPARSMANLEFHHTDHRINEICRKLVAELEARGVRALSPAMGFPMEMDRFPEKAWIVSHKRVAVEAGLGRMGIHRNVIHPKFGNFILLGTVILETELTEYSKPIDYDPCLECKLCVAACPVGAVGADGHFDFSACYTHNYREFMGGFSDWVENVAESRSAKDYRRRVELPETVSIWQSLSFGANYKAAYCMAVCPAGEDVLPPFLNERKKFLEEQVKPLQQKVEPVYVVPGSDAERHTAERFPHKRLRRVASGLRPQNIQGFLDGLSLVFQRKAAADLNAVYHFTFNGEERAEATVTIRNGTLRVQSGHIGKADLRITADSRTWLQFLAKEANIVWALLRRKIRMKGPMRLMLAFGRCFPS